MLAEEIDTKKEEEEISKDVTEWLLKEVAFLLKLCSDIYSCHLCIKLLFNFFSSCTPNVL